MRLIGPKLWKRPICPAPFPVSLMASSSTCPVQEEETIPLPLSGLSSGFYGSHPTVLGDGRQIAQPARYARAVVYKV